MVNQPIVCKKQEESNRNKDISNRLVPDKITTKGILLNMKKNKDIILHSIMCCIGGFMSGYALLCRGNLGSAQTINMIEIVFGIMGRNKEELLFRILGLLLYFAGIEFVVLLSKKTNINLKRYSILVDMAAFLVLAIIPDNASMMVGLLPMFFMLSTQWSVFSGTGGYTSSSVFSTNNFRQVILALNEYVFSKDKKQLKKAMFFINTLFWFHVNIAVSYYSVKYFSIYASLFGLIYAVPAFVITYMKDEKNSDTQTSQKDFRYAP